MYLFEQAADLVGWFRTGSSYICDPPVLNTDDDFVLYAVNRFVLRPQLEALGYEYSNKDVKEYKDKNKDPFAKYNVFDAYRHPGNNHNLIVVASADDFLKWKVATKVAKELNLLDKRHRIVLFRAIRSGGKHFEPAELPEPEDSEIPI